MKTEQAATTTTTSSSNNKKPSTLPAGFKLIGSSKESHGREIYCVSWSKNFFVEEVVPANISKKIDNDGDDEEVTSSSSEATNAITDASNKQDKDSSSRTGETSQQQQQHRQRKLRCFATCAGNQVTIYEVEIGSGTNNDGTQHPKQDAGLIVRQGYIDPDESETFYSCAFGGNCLGKPFGYRPVQSSSTSANTTSSDPIILQQDPRKAMEEKEMSVRKRARISGDEAFDDSNGGGSTSFGGRRNNDDDDAPSYSSLLDAKTFDGPQLLCVAGTRGIIKVIDPVRKMLFSTLSGHGDDIYDLKFSPVDEWLLLSASKDESLRLWNVQTTSCIAIFAGHEGHRDCVLSCGWHRFGDRFASGGMDTTVKLWEMEKGGQLETIINKSRSVKPTLWNSASNPNANFTTLYEQMPYFSTTKVHTNYVDCVQFVGDLILSKDTNNSIFLWLPKREKSKGNKNAAGQQQRLPNEMIALREFPLNKCNVWFIRFHTDLDCRMLAIGNTLGEIQVFELDDNPTKKHQLSLVAQYCTSCVRMVAFSPDNEFLVASRDDSSVWMWEANKSH